MHVFHNYIHNFFPCLASEVLLMLKFSHLILLNPNWLGQRTLTSDHLIYPVRFRGRGAVLWVSCMVTGERVTRKMRCPFIRNTSETWCRRWRSWDKSSSHCNHRLATVDWRCPGRKSLRWHFLWFCFVSVLSCVCWLVSANFSYAVHYSLFMNLVCHSFLAHKTKRRKRNNRESAETLPCLILSLIVNLWLHLIPHKLTVIKLEHVTAR